MKAAVLCANGDLRYQEYPTPKTLPGTVKVKVRAAGICGSDLPRVLHNGAHFYPVVLGHEFAGTVAEVGRGVTGLKIGQTVTAAPLLPCMSCDDCRCGNYALCKHYSFIGSRAQGAFADYVVLPAANAVSYSASVPFVQAAMFEPACVALHGVICADYRGGGAVAVLGGGTIGLFTMQWAKLYGAAKVTVIDIDPARLELARLLGADCAVNAAESAYLQEAAEAAGAGGYGYVFETAGSPVTMRAAFTLAAQKAEVCFIGTPHTEVSFPPALWEQLNRKEMRLTGSWMSYSAPFPGKEWELTARFFADGRLKFAPQMIDSTFPMAQAAEAFSLFKEPGQVHGKVMLLNEE